MTRIGLSLAVVALFVAAATPAESGPPPAPLVRFGATHAQPVAGQSFTGLSITPVNGTRISAASCDARLGHKTLKARVLRYHSNVGAQPVAVTCSWTIPSGSQGMSLRLSGESITTTSAEKASGFPVVWTVKS
jgi:hypothetical protein